MLSRAGGHEIVFLAGVSVCGAAAGCGGWPDWREAV